MSAYQPWRGAPTKSHPYVVSSWRGPVGAYTSHEAALEAAAYFAEYGAYVGSFEGEAATVLEVVELDGKLALKPVCGYEPEVGK